MARVARGYLDVRLDLLGFIPADPAIERAAERGRSIIDCVPAAPATGAFRRLADDLGGWQLTHTPRAGRAPWPEVRAGQV